MPASSGFEAGVASFLNSYAAAKDLRRQESDQRIRERQASDESNWNRIKMDEEGYSPVDAGTITLPDNGNFAQRVGRRLLGRSNTVDLGTSYIKTKPSVRETEINADHQFQIGRDNATADLQKAIEQMRENNAVALENTRNAGEMTRTKMNNATQVRVADINRTPTAIQQTEFNTEQRQQFVDRAVEAAGGDPLRAMSFAEQSSSATAKKLGLTRMDYYASAARFKDRKAALTREGLQTREEIAASKTGGNFATVPGVTPPPTAGSRRALTAIEKAHAQQNPTYAAALKSAGYSDRDFK